MEKQELIKIHGKSKVKDVAGILHNYTKTDSIEDHERLEIQIRKWGTFPLVQALPHMEDILYF